MNRKERFHAAWQKAEAEAADAKARAIKAKNDHRKSDYDFWVIAYRDAADKAEHFFNEYIEA